MELQYTLCTAQHLHTLVEIGKTTFKAAFAHLNDPTDFANYMQKAFSEETILSELEEPNSDFYLIHDDTALIGYIKCNVAPAQTDLNDPGSLELQRIYILSEAQGKGYGTKIMDWVKQLARSKGKSKLWLGVWEANERAIVFYQRHGFVKIGQHPYLIGTDEQMDWVMQTVL